MEVIEVTEREVEIIEVIERGPQGPTGPTGPQGPAGAGGVTSVSGTAPIVSSGGTTPTISVTTGSTAGTVAAGDDSRITGAAQKSANLSDLASASTARTNLGLGSAATSASTDFAAASHNHAASAITSGVFDNARINFAAPDAIGSTTRNTGAFTTLNANNGTITASAPVLDLSQTWNNAAVTFTGLRFNVTNTASAATSNTLELQNSGTAVFYVRRTGGVIADSITCTSGGAFRFSANAFTMFLQRDYAISWTNDPTAAGSSVTNDLILRRDAAGVLGQRDLANPQAYRIYNTTDAGLTNFERGFIGWSSNTLRIGTEKGGTGSARALEFQTDGVTRLTVAAAGTVSTSGNFNCVDLICSTLTVSVGSVTAAAAGALRWSGRARLNSPADSIITVVNAANTDFARLQFGGTTSSFPALKRSSTILQSRLADDSDFAPLQGQLRTHANAVSETITATHTLTLYDAAGTAYKVPCVAA